MTQVALQTLFSTGAASITARAIGFSFYTGAGIGLVSSVSCIVLNRLIGLASQQKFINNYIDAPKQKKEPPFLQAISSISALLAASKIGQMGSAFLSGRLPPSVACSPCSFPQAWVIASISSMVAKGSWPISLFTNTFVAYAMGLKPTTGFFVGITTVATIFAATQAKLLPSLKTWSKKDLKTSILNIGMNLAATKLAQLTVRYFSQAISFSEAYVIVDISRMIGARIANAIHQRSNGVIRTDEPGNPDDDDTVLL